MANTGPALAEVASLGCAPVPVQDVVARGAAPEWVGRSPTAAAVPVGPGAPMRARSCPGDAPALGQGRRVIDARTGIDGKPYAIGYELRLPEPGNGRFVLRAGGTDGGLRPAAGMRPGDPAALPLADGRDPGRVGRSGTGGTLRLPAGR